MQRKKVAELIYAKTESSGADLCKEIQGWSRAYLISGAVNLTILTF